MTTIDIALPQEIKAQALKCAVQRGISLERFIQEAIKKLLQESDVQNMEDDPFLADHAVFAGEVPSDLAENHDVYLYGENK